MASFRRRALSRQDLHWRLSTLYLLPQPQYSQNHLHQRHTLLSSCTTVWNYKAPWQLRCPVPALLDVPFSYTAVSNRIHSDWSASTSTNNSVLTYMLGFAADSMHGKDLRTPRTIIALAKFVPMLFAGHRVDTVWGMEYTNQVALLGYCCGGVLTYALTGVRQ